MSRGGGRGGEGEEEEQGRTAHEQQGTATRMKEGQKRRAQTDKMIGQIRGKRREENGRKRSWKGREKRGMEGEGEKRKAGIKKSVDTQTKDKESNKRKQVNGREKC